jgi:CDP-2,3-bis-(O-geranylgeranyl)-sn-glycerol synthase
MVVETVAVALWAMLPAYVPNNAAVLVGGGRPIDAGRTWHGRRILGDGKTWRGTAGGTLVGLALAGILTVLAPVPTRMTGVEFPQFPPSAAFGLAFGAILGDVLASFVKRRTGRERGASFPLVDQLDFVVVALALTALLAPGWFGDVFTLPRLAIVVVVTPILHVGTNVGAYLLGLKEEPY